MIYNHIARKTLPPCDRLVKTGRNEGRLGHAQVVVCQWDGVCRSRRGRKRPSGAMCNGVVLGLYGARISCTVGTLTFSSISISPSTTGDGVVGPITVTPVASGLSLSFSSAASAPPPSTADIAWLYTVASTVPIVDASLLLTGSGTGGGTVSLSETLSNGKTLTASSPGSATDSVTFPGVSSLSVAKDLVDVPHVRQLGGFLGYREYILDELQTHTRTNVDHAGCDGPWPYWSRQPPEQANLVTPSRGPARHRQHGGPPAAAHARDSAAAGP